MKIIGITGGTGAGKTTALRVLGEMGAEIIDCDALYYSLLEENTDMLSEINESFPGAVEGGKLQRKKLGEFVFGNAAALEKLSAITHRYVSRAIDGRITAARAEGRSITAIDAIALIESGVSKKCDLVVGVTAPEETRVQRIMKREGISRDYAEKRVLAQKNEEFFRSGCDMLLVNDFESEEAFSRYCRDKFKQLEENSNG